MLNNGLIDPKLLKDFLIERKGKALEMERRSTGSTKAAMTGQVQTVDALLIFLNTQMEEQDVMALNIRLGAPVPISQLKAKSRKGQELTAFLIEAAGQVPKGQGIPLEGDVNADTVYSKIWTMRERGQLPEHIVPSISKDPETGKRTVSILHKTPDELAAMRKGRGTVKAGK